MGDVIYRPLIEDMTWSYSRLSSFEECPYRWFLTYIRNEETKDLFYANYGSFMHRLLEQYYRGILTRDGMMTKFLTDFKKEVRGAIPGESVVQKYIENGLSYLESFPPLRFELVDVEKRIDFTVKDLRFVGFVDYIGKENGNYVIVDHKSKDMKPRSKRTNPTAKDAELDNSLRQLYLYAEAVRQAYGKLPSLLCFNCFRTGVFIEEPFSKQKYEETLDWAEKTAERIKSADDFPPRLDYFFCRYLCDVCDACDYYEMGGGFS